MKEHSEAAWNIASAYSGVLASETRDLATRIDEALSAERRRSFGLAGRLMNIKIDLQTGKSKQYAIDRIAEILNELDAAAKAAA